MIRTQTFHLKVHLRCASCIFIEFKHGSCVTRGSPSLAAPTLIAAQASADEDGGLGLKKAGVRKRASAGSAVDGKGKKGGGAAKPLWSLATDPYADL